MSQILKLKRGSLERLSSITGSLQKGEVIESGTHQELMTNDSGLYQKLSKLQFELN